MAEGLSQNSGAPGRPVSWYGFEREKIVKNHGIVEEAAWGELRDPPNRLHVPLTLASLGA